MSNVIFDTSSDPINTLPIDQIQPSTSEMQIIESLFKQQKNINKLLSSTQDILLIGLLFIIFNIPQTDSIINKIFPTTTTSPYILLSIKTLIFMSSYFILKNIYLVRKK